MPSMIKLAQNGAEWAEDDFVTLLDEDALTDGNIIVSLPRFLADIDSLFATNRKVGVKIEPDQEVEALAPYIDRLAVVALAFPKYRDGRAYTSARLLRQRLGFTGEVRAVGDVLREQAGFMVRCGMDAFVPADGSGPEDWTKAVNRYRHVYQRAADERSPVFEERRA